LKRRTEDITMPLAEGSVVMHPEAALLHWPTLGRRLDIGQSCYLKRDTSSNHRAHHSFDLASLSKERIKAVRRVIAYFSEVTRLGSVRPRTLFLNGTLVVRLVNWADAHGLHGVLCDPHETEKAARAYGLEQRELVSQSKKSRNSVANEQRALLSTLRDFFGDDNFGANIQTMRFRRKHVAPTEVPDSERQGLLIACADAFFTSISSHVLEFKPYPFSIVTSLGETVHVVPHGNSASRRDGVNSRGFLAWNLQKGEMRSRKELYERFVADGCKFPHQRVYGVLRAASELLEESNVSAQSAVRREHAVTAAYAFAALFLAETGINLSQLQGMKWSPELSESVQSPSVVRQKFREVKYRAGGVEIAFKVSVGFMPKLKTYLKLREYLVQDASLDALFIGRGRSAELVDLSPDFLNQLYMRLEGFGIVLPRVTARQWRAAKQDWAISNHGPVVAAKLLGHSLETAIRAYSNGTDSAHKAEMGAFLASVEKTILRANETVPGSIKSAVGACVDFQKPEPIALSMASEAGLQVVRRVSVL
jgi:integrase